MKVWLTRIIAIAFVLSLVASPQSALVAAQADIPAATPVVETTTPEATEEVPNPTSTSAPDEGDKQAGESATVVDNKDDELVDQGNADPRRSQSEPTKDAESRDQEYGKDEPESVATPRSLQSEGLVAPLNFYAKNVPLPSYDPVAETLTISVELQAGFSANAGDWFEVEYENLDLSAASGATFQVTGVPGLIGEVDHYSDRGFVDFTFQNDVAPLSEAVTGSLSISATVVFEACSPSANPYPNDQELWFRTPTTSGYQTVEGPECPASIDPVISYVDYDEDRGACCLRPGFWELPHPVQKSL